MEQMAILYPSDEIREGNMLLAGNLTMTVTSLKTGDHITVKCACKRKSNSGWERSGYAEATHVFLSVPSAGGWPDKIGTYYPKTGRLYPAADADPARVWAAQRVLLAACGVTPHPQTELLTADRCGRCGRQLTDPISVSRGIGPECWGKETGSHHQRRVVVPIEQVEVEPSQLRFVG